MAYKTTPRLTGYKKTFQSILDSALFRLDGPPINLTDKLIKLGNQVHNTEDVDWYIGEFGDCCLSDFVVGAYWSLTEWHSGQTSATYAAMCSLGSVFSPGMSDGPEEGSSEKDAYELINEYYKSGGK